MQCVILAGGRGTRLATGFPDIPKHLVPVGGVPFADHQLRWLQRQGVTDIVYSIGYLGSQIRDYVGTGERYGLAVCYVDEGEVLRGTGGAIRLAHDHGVLHEAFFLLYGDSWLDIDLADVMATFKQSNSDALMTVYKNQGSFDRSNAVFDGTHVRYDKIDPSPDMLWIDYGVSVMARFVADSISPDIAVDLASVFHELGEVGALGGYEAVNRFYEVGTPASLAELEARLRAN